MEFSEEQKKEIEELAGLNYLIKQVAMILEIPAEDLYLEYEDPDSQFRYHYDRGQLISQATVGKKQLEAAKSGNLTASAQYLKQAQFNHLNNLKHELFGV